jgi:hypothetical protein
MSCQRGSDALRTMASRTLHLILTLPAMLHAFQPGKEGDKAMVMRELEALNHDGYVGVVQRALAEVHWERAGCKGSSVIYHQVRSWLWAALVKMHLSGPLLPREQHGMIL